MIPVSILDLCPVSDGQTAARSFRNSLELAQLAERAGYTRFWLAEHHNMPGIASAATAVVIGHIAGGTKKIRVGSGGIMLPNHSPLVVAEQFGTLESLYPGRIDLGLGRAPGTDPLTSQALRRDIMAAGERFPQDVQELQILFDDVAPGQKICAVPGAGLHVPLWMLGSSTFGAQLAAALGLPYAFASHFAPDALEAALHVYRSQFRPSAQLEKPYFMLTVNVLAADTEEEAKFHFTSHQQSFINLRRGRPAQLPAPIDDIESYWSPAEKAMVQHALQYAFVGTPAQVEKGLAPLIERIRPDEVMLTGHVYDHAARLKSFELAAELPLFSRAAAC
ncbi:MAG TPA: LLM class flavin-dependent oxidoreductase [Patescibacteria group bacterium]|nr:LLM class flavin-dependent oxidoreductase [Patescibacteria group bacterium]